MDIFPWIQQNTFRYGSVHSRSPLPLRYGKVNISKAVIIAVVALIGLSACGSVESPRPQADGGDVCVSAAKLIEANEPQQALDLITKVRAARPTQPPKSPGVAPSATSTEPPAADGLTCQQQVTDALAKLGAQSSEAAKPSWSQMVREFGQRWLTPLNEHFVLFMTILASLLVLTRFLTRVRWISHLRLGHLRARSRCFICSAGFALLLGGAYFTVALFNLVEDKYTGNPKSESVFWPLFWPVFWPLVSAMFAAVIGAGMLAAVVASRLKVSIIAHDKEGKLSETTTSRVVAYLTELAGAPPRGLETPQATDATALSGSALVELSANKVLATVQKVFQTLLAVVPWTVVIDESNDGSLSVLMKLNGWNVAAIPMTTKVLGLGGTSQSGSTTAVPDLQKMAAAVVVANLARNHRGFEGLCGASRWRSIALQYIATTDFRDDPETARILLAHALEADPKNLLAELSLQHQRYRESSDEDELLTYMKWTETRSLVCKDKSGRIKPGYRDLYRRLLMNHAVAALNFRDVHGPLSVEQQHTAEEQANQLMRELAGVRVEPGSLRDVMRPVAAVAHRDITQSQSGNSDWFDMARVSLAPWTSYNMACHYASKYQKRSEDPTEDKQKNLIKIKNHLSIAFVDTNLKAWAKKDPSLVALHELTWFQTLTGATPREIWDIDPLAKHKDALAAIGVRTPSQLLAIAHWRLCKYLKTSSLKVERLIRLARLAERVETTAVASGNEYFKDLHVEITAALIDLGIETPDEIVNNPQTRTDLATRIKGRCLVVIPTNDIRIWLTNIRN